MPKEEKNFKRLIRERMQRTGESYTTARARLELHSPSGSEPSSALPSRDQYLYVKTLSASFAGHRLSPTLDGTDPRAGFYWSRHMSTSELWIDPNGNGRMVRAAPPEVTWLTEEGAKAWAANQAVKIPSGRTRAESARNDPSFRHDGPYGRAGGLIYPNNVGLPADPVELKAAIQKIFDRHLEENRKNSRLRGRFEQHPDPRPVTTTTLFGAVAELQAGSSLDVRQAAIQMLRQATDCADLGPMTDSLGREGVGIAVNDTTGEGVQNQLIFDLATSTILEQRTVQIAKNTRMRERKAQVETMLRERNKTRGVQNVADPSDATTPEGRFQLRCRELIVEIQSLGVDPTGWISLINRLSAVGAVNELFDRGTVLPITHWLLERERLDLTMENEIRQPRWSALFTDQDRAKATDRIAETRELLANSPVVRDDSGPPIGSVVQYTTYIASGVVDSNTVTTDGTVIPINRTKPPLPPGLDLARLDSRNRLRVRAEMDALLGDEIFAPGAIAVVDPEDESTIDGRFQLRCRGLITEIEGLGLTPGGWIRLINKYGAVGAVRKLFERQFILPITYRLVEQERADLTMEYEIGQPRWNGLFTDDERAMSVNRLVEVHTRKGPLV
jgi:hypothetical protein